MARRSAPPNSGPAYYNGARGSLPDPNESKVAAFFRDEIFASDKLPGNIKVVTGLALFFGGIAVVRTWGELLIPA